MHENYESLYKSYKRTEEKAIRIENHYDNLLKNWQRVLLENADIKDQLLQKDRLIDHYEKLLKYETRR